MDSKTGIKMKELKNKLERYKALQISNGKWIDFEAGEIKKVPADTAFNSGIFELIIKKPTKAKKSVSKKVEPKKEEPEEEKD
jgi:hypothetical protein